MNARTPPRLRPRGAALLELALVMPMLLLVSLVIAELGRGVYQYGQITRSVRDAARYLSMQTPNTHQLEARNLVVFGNTAGSGTPVAAGLAVTHVPQPQWQTTGSAPAMTMVSIEVNGYVFQSLFAGAFGSALGNIPFGSIRASMRSAT